MANANKRLCSFATAAIANCLVLAAGAVSAGEPPATRTAIDDRGADFRRLNPGVPSWPSTCDCISVGFGLKDASGFRPVRFRFADAVDYYGQGSDVASKPGLSTSMAKGPLKELVEE